MCAAAACSAAATLPNNEYTKRPPCEPSHCYQHWVELSYKERWGMKIVKRWKKKPEECAATRCMNVPVGTVMGECFDQEGELIPLCDRHLNEATTEFKLWEIEGSVTRTDGASPPAPQAAPADLAVEMQREQEEAQSFLAELENFEIQTQEELAFIADILAETKGKIKALEGRRSEITKPINAALKSVRDLFAPPINALKQGEVQLKSLIGEAKAREEKENQAAIAAAAKALDSGDNVAAQEAAAQVRHTSNIPSVRTREVWAFEITDPDKVDRVLCTPDPKKIRQLIKEADDPTQFGLKGIRFFRETVVASGSK